MSAIDSSASRQGTGSEAWSRSWTHFHVDRRRSYCGVTLDDPRSTRSLRRGPSGPPWRLRAAKRLSPTKEDTG